MDDIGNNMETHNRFIGQLILGYWMVIHQYRLKSISFWVDGMILRYIVTETLIEELFGNIPGKYVTISSPAVKHKVFR